jgi:hypothetical protein
MTATVLKRSQLLRTEKGICREADCGNSTKPGRVRCTSHQSTASLEYWVVCCEALDAYGGTCICCGDTRKQYLELDHINNDGAADRKLLGFGSTFFRRLKALGYPPRLQVLCANCHRAKTRQMKCHGRHWIWHLQTRGKGGKPQVTRYVREHGRTKNVFLAREIMGIDSSSPKQVYPLDGDPFNMQRDNLGVAAERRRIQHRATVRKLGGTRRIPQMGIAPIVNMAGFIESALRLGQESPYDGN